MPTTPPGEGLPPPPQLAKIKVNFSLKLIFTIFVRSYFDLKNLTRTKNDCYETAFVITAKKEQI